VKPLLQHSPLFSSTAQARTSCQELNLGLHFVHVLSNHCWVIFSTSTKPSMRYVQNQWKLYTFICMDIK